MRRNAGAAHMTRQAGLRNWRHNSPYSTLQSSYSGNAPQGFTRTPRAHALSGRAAARTLVDGDQPRVSARPRVALEGQLRLARARGAHQCDAPVHGFDAWDRAALHPPAREWAKAHAAAAVARL